MSGVKKPIKHGTIGGYVAHRRRGEEPCTNCLRAWRIYYQQRNGTVARTVWRLRKQQTKATADSLRRYYDGRNERRKAQRAADRSAREEAQRARDQD